MPRRTSVKRSSELGALEKKYAALRKKREARLPPQTNQTPQEVIAGFIELSTKVAQSPMTCIGIRTSHR